MRTVEIELVHGLPLDGQPQKLAVIREANAGDVIEGSEESEKLVMTQSGEYQLVPSPTLVAANVLCKQVVSIGEIKGPLTLKELKKLSPDDMQLLQITAQTLEEVSLKATTQEVSNRGRSGTDSTSG